MACEYKLHDEAVIEYADAYEWYEKREAGRGEKFLEAIDLRVLQICNHPQFYSKISRSYRQASVDGFPYTIVYQYFPKRSFVHIAAIHHDSRHPKHKFRKEGQ